MKFLFEGFLGVIASYFVVVAAIFLVATVAFYAAFWIHPMLAPLVVLAVAYVLATRQK